jgi:hypothetical protein
MLGDTTKNHHVLVTTETNGLLVSLLKEPAQNKESYIEILLTESHPLYKRIYDAIAVLNMAGELEKIEDLGECFMEGCFHVKISEEEHRTFITGV